jgi:hypothetical protein
MTNFSIGAVCKKYAQLKIRNEILEMSKRKAQMEKLAVNIIDHFSQQDFQLPLEEHILSSKGKTTYVYKNNSTFQNLFEFLSELLNLPIPIMIGATTLGLERLLLMPRIITASRELKSCTAAIRNLVLAKRVKWLRSLDLTNDVALQMGLACIPRLRAYLLYTIIIEYTSIKKIWHRRLISFF